MGNHNHGLRLAGDTPPFPKKIGKRDSHQPRKLLLKIGIFVFDKMQILDFAGPYDILATVPEFQVFTVAKSREPVCAHHGLTLIPTYDFEHMPPLDILVIPGGKGTDREREDQRVIAWIKAQAQRVQYVLTICTGAFLLAETGLLNGKKATTYHDDIDEFKSRYPSITILDRARYVDNGRMVISAGVSAGMDGALYLVAKIRGKATAQKTAHHLEYRMEPS